MTGDVSREIEDAVAAAIARKLEGADVLELKLSQKIAERVMSWTKLFGFFIGIPLFVVSSILGFFGIKAAIEVDYLNKEIIKIQGNLNEKKKEVEKVSQEADLVNKRAESVKESFLKIDVMMNIVSDQLNKSLLNMANEATIKYDSWLRQIGWNEFFTKNLSIFTDKNPPTVEKDCGHESWTSFYCKETMYFNEKVVFDTSILLHAYSLSLLDEARKVDKDQKFSAGVFSQGISDYLVSSYRNDPVIGKMIVPAGPGNPSGGYRNLNNFYRYDESADNVLHYQLSSFGGALWRCGQLTQFASGTQGAADRSRFDKIVVESAKSVLALPDPGLPAFLKALTDQARREDPKIADCLLGEIDRRKLPL